jgi:Spy/CpxP family protein refolding chaperone
MLTPTFSRLAVLSALTALLAGCGQAGTMLAAKSNAPQAQGAHGKRPGGPGGFLFGLEADLGLTADQQAALKALMEKHKPAAPPSHDANNPHKALHDLILGEKIDDAALRAAIAAVEADRAKHPRPDFAAQLKGVYEILTAEQRAKIVAKLQAAPEAKGPRPEGSPKAYHSPRPRPSGDPKGALNLTAEQQAALDALKAKQQAGFEAHKPGDQRAAMLAFWQTGDASGLALPEPPAFPVEEFVKAVEILDQAQRKALFGHGFGFGGPGGPGGRGHGRHGFGGPGGHGHPGGPGAKDAPAPAAP